MYQESTGQNLQVQSIKTSILVGAGALVDYHLNIVKIPPRPKFHSRPKGIKVILGLRWDKLQEDISILNIKYIIIM